MLFMKHFVEIKTKKKKRKKTLSYTFLLRITCNKKRGEEGVQIACKNAYLINGRPPMNILDAHNESLNKLDL